MSIFSRVFTSFRAPATLAFLTPGWGLTACMSEEGGDVAAVPQDAAPVADAGPKDAAPPPPEPEADASLADIAGEFCGQLAAAKCAWAFACEGLSAADRSGALRLPGDDEADCAEKSAKACVDDTADRAARETLVFDAVEVPDCLDGVRRARCLPSPASDWVVPWRELIYGRCNKVLQGNVAEDAACVQGLDCETAGSLCAEGVCREPTLDDLQADCDARANDSGFPNADDACPGGTCVSVGTNDSDKKGICSVDCSETQEACPDSSACLHSTNGAANYFYCTAVCRNDRDCKNGFACEPINSGMPDGDKHCWAR